MSLLLALKREFDFYCIELCTKPEPAQPEVAFVLGGMGDVDDDDNSDDSDCDYDDIDFGAVTLSSMERYDTLSGQWSVAAAMGTARSKMGACVVAGELYVTCGKATGSNFLSSVERYSPSSDTWSAVAPMPEARLDHAAVTVGSAIYVLDGEIDEEVTPSTLKFDSEQGSWKFVASMPEARTGLAACAVGSNIFVFGGGNSKFMIEATVFKYDTMTDAWSTLASMPSACACHSASVLDGLVYILGDGAVDCGILRFDPASGAFTRLASTASDRRQGASFVLCGSLYAAGGQRSNPSADSSSVERYDVTINTWTAAPNMIEGRMRLGAVATEFVSPAEDRDLFDSLIAKASLLSTR
jgi:hypothetical protein